MDNAKRHPIAFWQASMDGVDLTDRLRPHLLSLSLTEKRGDEADEIELVLDDRDGALEIPPAGRKLKIKMGWKQGVNLPIGLIDKGEFKVDEASWRGDPDQIAVRARSADLTDAFAIRRERSFVEMTVGEILKLIAADNGYAPHIDQALADRVIPALGAQAKSDAALLRDLGKRFDAVATIKMGKLIFAPIGKGQSVSGQTIPTETIDRSQCAQGGKYERAERDTYNGVEARYHDAATGQTRTVVVGGGKGDGKPKRLRKTYASESSARQAAVAEDKRVSRTKAKMSLPLAYGRPDITPERPITLSGFKSEINEQKWIVVEATHTMDGNGGLMTSLTLETNGK